MGLAVSAVAGAHPILEDDHELLSWYISLYNQTIAERAVTVTRSSDTIRKIPYNRYNLAIQSIILFVFMVN